MSRAEKRSRRRPGCLILVGVLLALIVAALVVVVVAKVQIGSIEAESQLRSQPTDDLPATAPLLINLRIHTVALMLTPTAEGSEVTVETNYDPSLYLFTQNSIDLPNRRELRMEFAPSGSTLMALLRAKLGAPLPTLRIGIPRDVSLEIVGEVFRSMSFMELGDSSVERIDLRVSDGGLKLNVAQPLRRPMREFELNGSKASLTVNGLGNASPRRTSILAHIGVLDLDLRGAWVDDGQIDVIGAVAGGSIWLPDNVHLIGIDDLGLTPAQSEPELPGPTLSIAVDERVGRILVMR